MRRFKYQPPEPRKSEQQYRTNVPVWRVHVTVPGILMPAIRQRWDEFFYRCFSPFAIELVCFDLCRRIPHDLTHPFSEDPPVVQDAIDREIVRRYKPHSERNNGFLFLTLYNRIAAEQRACLQEPGLLTVEHQMIRFPAVLRDIIKQRRLELGFKSLSGYVTSLIRYDLMLSGPHKYFNGKEMDPELLAALDLKTIDAFHARRKQRILLYYLIDQAVGRKLSDEERREYLHDLSKKLRDNAVSSQKVARRAGIKA